MSLYDKCVDNTAYWVPVYQGCLPNCKQQFYSDLSQGLFDSPSFSVLQNMSSKNMILEALDDKGPTTAATQEPFTKAAPRSSSSPQDCVHSGRLSGLLQNYYSTSYANCERFCKFGIDEGFELLKQNLFGSWMRSEQVILRVSWTHSEQSTWIPLFKSLLTLMC